MKLQYLGDELSNQKLTNQPFMVKGTIDLGGKLVLIIMPFKELIAFESYLESIDEHYDAETPIVIGVDLFIEIGRKVFDKVEKSDYGEGRKNTDEKIVEYLDNNSYIPKGAVNSFFPMCCLFIFDG